MNRGSLVNIFDDVQPYLREVVRDGFSEEETVYDKVFNVSNINKQFENDTQISGLGIMPVVDEEEDAGLDRLFPGYDKKYTPVKYRMGVPYTKEMFDDDQWGVVKDLGLELGRSARATMETVAANVFNRAFSGSYLGPDSKALCVTDHPMTAAVDGSNALATPADLSVSSLQDLWTLMKVVKNNRGLPNAQMPEILLIPPELEFIAEEIIGSSDRPDTADRATNVLHRKLRIISWQYLTDTDAWFLLTAPSKHKVKFKMRKPFGTEEYANVPKDRIELYGGMRFDVGWTTWEGVAGTPGA